MKGSNGSETSAADDGDASSLRLDPTPRLAVVYGCDEPKWGSAARFSEMMDAKKFNHQFEIAGGVLIFAGIAFERISRGPATATAHEPVPAGRE